jgi:hypothetical protein
MMRIEVVGLDPPCEKCNELLENARKAVSVAGIKASVEKRWALAPEVRAQYGLLLSPALIIDGMVVAQGKVFKTERIVDLLKD